jgi:hypothetical protein
MALEGSREGKGEAACAVLYSCIAYITSQQGRVFEVRHQQSLGQTGYKQHHLSDTGTDCVE